MNKWIVLLIIIVVLGGAFFYFWYTTEKPIQDEIKEKINLSIFSVENNKRVITGYNIKVSNNYVYNGTTLLDGFSFVSLIKNHQLSVQNYNLEGQNYYIDIQEINITNWNNTQIRLNLIEPSEANVEIVNEYLKEEYIIFNLTTERLFKNLIVCSEWSINIIYLKGNYPVYQIPENYKTYDKCFDIGYTLNSTNNLTLEFDFKRWGQFNDKDFLRFVFIDKDLGITYNENKSDVFAPDKIIELI